MQAFHNKQKVRAFYVNRLQKHHRLDQIVQGTGFENGRGCNVGCILNNYEHELYPTKLGLPVWYAHLCDVIFEGLPADKAPAFALASLTAISTGADIERVRWQLGALRLQRLKQSVRGVDSTSIEIQRIFQSALTFCKIRAVGSPGVASLRRSEITNDIRNLLKSSNSGTRALYQLIANSLNETDHGPDISAYRAAHWLYKESSLPETPHYIWEAETLVLLLLECK